MMTLAMWLLLLGASLILLAVPARVKTPVCLLEDLALMLCVVICLTEALSQVL